MKKFSLNALNKKIERAFYADDAVGNLARRTATVALSAFVAIPVTAVAAIGYSFYKGDSSALSYFNSNATYMSASTAIVGFLDSFLADKAGSSDSLNTFEKVQNFSDQKEKMNVTYGSSVFIAAVIAVGLNARTIYNMESSQKDDIDSKSKSTGIFYTPIPRAKNIPSLKELTA